MDKTLIINRNYKENDSIFGTAIFSTENTKTMYYSIERIGYEIPKGTYEGIFCHSPRFGTNLYLINVPNRQGIRIHVANWSHELKGCIGLGLIQGKDGIYKSKDAVKLFHRVSEGDKIKIIIKDVRQNLKERCTAIIRRISQLGRKKTSN
jgi:hypothetical protein